MFSLCLYSVSLTTASAVAALALAVVVVGLSGGFLARLEVRYAFENVRRVDDIFHLIIRKTKGRKEGMREKGGSSFFLIRQSKAD